MRYICPCGLICTDCLFYKPEIYAAAKKLKDTIENSQFDIFLGLVTKNESWKTIAEHLNEKGTEIGKYFEAFKNFPVFMHFLDGLIQLQCKATCRETGGCSMGGTLHKCDAVQCVESKGHEGCWECPESENCKKLNFVRRGYGETINKTFQAIKENGFDAVKSRGNKYYAWQKEK